MEHNNNQGEYNAIRISSMIGEIKKYVQSMIGLDDKKTAVIDCKIRMIIQDLFSNNDNKVTNDNVVYNLLTVSNDVTDIKVRNILVLLYTALYYDNVTLLNKMLQEGVGFELQSQYLGLFLLNNEITSKFQDDEYLKIVEKWRFQLAGFYDSIKDLDEEERKKYIDRFACLIKNMKTDFKKDMPYHLFNKHALDNYEDKTYLLATEEQLIAIGSAPWAYYTNSSGSREESLKRLNNLLQTTEFDKQFVNFDLMFELFTDEELLNLGWSESWFFNMMSDTKEMKDKAMDLYRKCPEYVKSFGWGTNPTALRTIDNDILIEMKKSNINLGLRMDILKPLANLYRPKVLVKKLLHKN